MADEQQDVNQAQNQLISLLTSYHAAPNIFTVGDEKQAIYRFQGASLENFIFFEERYPGAKTISLTENYRSGQIILDAAHSLITAEAGVAADLRVPLRSNTNTTAEVIKRVCLDEFDEHAWLSAEINKLVKSGELLREIAVIVRTNREVSRLANELRSAGISVNPSAEHDALSHPVALAVLNLIKATVSPEKEESLFNLLHAPYWNVPQADVVRIVSARSQSLPLSKIISSPAVLTSLGIEEPASVLNLATVISEGHKRSVSIEPQQVLAYLLETSGFLSKLLTYDDGEGMAVVRRLYEEIEAQVVSNPRFSLTEIIHYFDRISAHGLAMSVPFLNRGREAISIMTAHKAKGLEFDFVFVPHLTDDRWGGIKRNKAFSLPLTKLKIDDEVLRLDDEKRLLYVAMTRARRRLWLSLSRHNSDSKTVLPSRLLTDIAAKFITEEESVESASSNPLIQGIMFVPRPTLDNRLVIELLTKRGFSATSFNNWIDSPWQYWFRSLLRIPEVRSQSALYGTAIHSVLEKLVSNRNEAGDLPDANFINHHLRQALENLPLNPEALVSLHEIGFTALLLYREHLSRGLSERVKTEVNLRVIFQTKNPVLPEIPLTGTIDRIDLNNQGEALRVVDYKTGKAKSRNEIEGKTKNSLGHYKRQLIFYALLLSLHNDSKLMTREGAVSFVEPDVRGIIKEESFTITDADITNLKQEICAAVNSLVSGEWRSLPCDPARCDYCHLVKLI